MYLACVLKRVGKVVDVVGTVVVESVVAEVADESCLLGLQVGHAELSVSDEVSLSDVCLDDAVFRCRECVADGIPEVWFAEMNIV